MKKIRPFLILAFTLYLNFNTFAKSTIVIRISNPNTVTQQKIIDHLLKLPGVSFEYGCEDVGLIVVKEDGLKINDSRELKTFIKNELSKVNRKFRVLLLEVIIESKETTSHC